MTTNAIDTATSTKQNTWRIDAGGVLVSDEVRITIDGQAARA
jgi:hypothetical protein